VVYLGHAVEAGSAKTLFANPRHPYTQALLSATPVANPGAKKERIVLQGEMPSPFNPPSGCAFHPRCRAALGRCSVDVPVLQDKDHRQVACWAVDA
jgi:dipeptide transport system ATP-binding protein